LDEKKLLEKADTLFDEDDSYYKLMLERKQKSLNARKKLR